MLLSFVVSKVTDNFLLSVKKQSSRILEDCYEIIYENLFGGALSLEYRIVWQL